MQAAIASQRGFPVVDARGRFRHERLDTGRAKHIGHFFHLVSAALAVLQHTSDHVAGSLSPVHPWIGLGERFVNAIGGAILAGGKRAFHHQRFQALDDDAAAHLDGGGGANGAVHHIKAHPIR